MDLRKWVTKITSYKPSNLPEADLQGFLRCQRLAEEGAQEISTLIQEGWTEIQAASLLETYLRDHGVKAFFHHAYAWFGNRTRFDNIHYYWDYMPEKRVIRPGEVFILDVAPILEGYIADIGFTSSLGENLEYKKAMQFLDSLRAIIPSLFLSLSGNQVWEEIDRRIQDAGYENIHTKYPFSVLGHRVHSKVPVAGSLKFLNFGWQSYWSITSRGIFGELLSPTYDGPLNGVWAIEPHIGTKDPSGNSVHRFGAKFEEILVVEDDKAYWLEKERIAQ